MGLNTRDVTAGMKELRAYPNRLERKCRTLCERLAMLGATRASLDLSHVPYTGSGDFNVRVERRDGGYAVIADGAEVLFLEFGAGIKMGYGHPQDAQFGMGPGTYPIPPGKGHWDDENGWWLPKEKGGGHTYGNPPGMGMYNASQDMRRELERIAREVFAE